jgi:hypothetical protein
MKNKPYKIPQLPFGWYCDDVSFTLVDAATMSDNDDTTESIKVTFEDNGAGHFLKCTYMRNDVPIDTFEIDAESLQDIGAFCNAIAEMMDKGRDRAFDETRSIWECDNRNLLPNGNNSDANV